MSQKDKTENDLPTGKRKLEESETSSSDDDEDNLFVPQGSSTYLSFIIKASCVIVFV